MASRAKTVIDLTEIPPDRPVLIHGPTASGKSALALRIAEARGGVIVNADALQVYQGWPILSAQPDAAERTRAPHALYGHLPFDAPYSAGDWLRDVAPFLSGPDRPIIVGGTGLYFAALTEGLADIPRTPPEIRAEADAMPHDALIAELDAETRAGLDLRNRARVQRAWEVQRATGHSIRAWQVDTPPPLLPLAGAVPLVLVPEVDWLNARIARRFDEMIDAGALNEARAMRPRWNPALQSSRAIGAAELIAHLDGRMTLEQAREAAVIASRQYAKRQRTWSRARMGAWRRLDLPRTG
ncbi:MAG: tRNA (adenosine(37)-N6)-dimethylallyltransferase MiaA [Alphaproteobacteria bacterium]|jgi:tRNA dimethylallyltransferase|nr:tRNA (adenosine(37)-N6)-dimethylallyltransferase MiaA [Alphaproteobacteria bacterium]